MRKISIIMGVYNNAATLMRALESLNKQTYEYWQLVACDDASTDGSGDILAAWGKINPGRLVLLKNDTRSYLAAALNKCLKYADGDFIARMDGDDYCAPDRLEKQLEFLDGHPGIDLCGTAMRVFDDAGETQLIRTCPNNPDGDFLYRGNPFAGATIMARRKVFDVLGGYTDLPRTRRCEDRDLWFRFFAGGFHGGNLQAPLYFVFENRETRRRRGAITRFNLMRTEYYGYKLLNYPFLRYRKPLLNFLKCLVPAELIYKYQLYIFRKADNKI